MSRTRRKLRLAGPARHERRGIMRHVRYLMDMPARGFDAPTLGDLYDWLRERDERKSNQPCETLDVPEPQPQKPPTVQ